MKYSVFPVPSADVCNFQEANLQPSFPGALLPCCLYTVRPLLCSNPTQGDLFGYVLDLSGGITGSITGFILPALTYLQVTKGMADQGDIEGRNIGAYRTGCKFLFVFGSIVVVMVPIAVVLDIRRKETLQ